MIESELDVKVVKELERNRQLQGGSELGSPDPGTHRGDRTTLGLHGYVACC